MEKLLKIDMHVHTKAISLCSQIDGEALIDAKIEEGYDGVVLTNHCQPWYYPPEEHASYIERVIEEFHRGKEYADRRNFRFYLGLEITLIKEGRYADWLLYGATEEFLRKTPCLYQLTQKELFELCDSAGIILIQAHPFRGGGEPWAPTYMHGVEINCTEGDIEKKALVMEFAQKHRLLVTCGTDYHGVARACRGGIAVPEGCETSEELARYIKKGSGTILLK